ncbi:MAG: OmpA family protein [Flavobacteriales bacterium]|nr:OmpA family protein [Flavobacteriales bacterium]
MRKITILLLATLAAFNGRAQIIQEVTLLDVRPYGEDYAPLFLDSGFVMCSVREAPGTITVTDAVTAKPLSDLYWVPYDNGKTGTPVLFSTNLASIVNEGPAAFTDGGTTICYTRNLEVPKKLSARGLKNGQLGLFFAHQVHNAWSAPVAFEHNSSEYSVLHPTFSKDGKQLVFASDMPGGHGGMDIYYSERIVSGWTAPVNMGPTINGPYNEVYPRFGKDGTLYFSSNRPGGSGQLDILSCSSNNGKFSAPSFLPTPINGPANDHSYSELGDDINALFSSDRTGSDRIFKAKRTITPFQECREQKWNNYCYAVKQRPQSITGILPLEHAWDMGDGTMIRGLAANHCYANRGTYMVRSVLVDKRTGDVFHVVSSKEINVSDHEQAWISAPDTVRTGRVLALDATQSNIPGIAAVDHIWDMGDGTQKEGTRIQHQFKTPGMYTVRLDVVGRPDVNGRMNHRCNYRTIVVIDRFKDHEDMAVVATYQDALGTTHVFEYQEIPFDEHKIEGQDLADVNFSVILFASKERVSLEDPRFIEVRKLYRIVERFDPIRAEYTYGVGDTKNIEELYQVYRKVKELQFMDAEVFGLQVEQLMDLSKLDMASLEELAHSKLRTSAIHFAYKSATLEPGSEVVLDQVIATMRQHPELELVIEAHTDDVGGSAYNLDLSQKRAIAVVDHLFEHGIEPNRLTPVGHGKNQPIASNKTEAGRAQNRRVEFRMVVRTEQAPGTPLLSGAMKSSPVDRGPK